MPKKQKSKTNPQPQWLTIGELKRQLSVLKVPADSSIKIKGTSPLNRFRHLSFCRETGEVSLW